MIAFTLLAFLAIVGAVITIGEDMPSGSCIEANSHALARYAALCQECGLVPMVEPEVLMDGDHDIETCYEVTEVVLRSLFDALYNQNVMLEGTILKASMVVPGKDCPTQASVEEVAEATLMCLKSAVPAIMPGIVFLSGGQSDEAATAHHHTPERDAPGARAVLARLLDDAPDLGAPTRVEDVLAAEGWARQHAGGVISGG